jgi:hypothetical protein
MRKKVGLFTLGIILILCGTFMLLNRYTNFSLPDDIYLLWPVFLILLGLEFIFTKLWYDVRKTDVYLSPSGISIFLAILLLLFSSIWLNQGFGLFNWNFNFNGNWPVMFGDTIEDTYEYKLEDTKLNNAEKIVVENFRGSLEVYPADNNELRIEAHIQMKTNNKDEAEKLLDKVITIEEGTTVQITSKNPAAAHIHSLQHVNMKLWVPKDMEAQLSTSFGRILVHDRDNNVMINQRHNDIELERITGNIEIDTSFGNTRILKAKGDIQIQSAHGRVTVDEISGKVRVSNSFDDTTVSRIARDVSIQSKHGRVKVENVAGNVLIDNEYDDINCSGIEGNLEITARHSEIHLSEIKGDINAETSYEDIQLTNPAYTNADIKASTTYGVIRSDRAISLNVQKENNLQEASLIIGSGDQKIRLKNQHGDIRINLK